ncbi:uncharacterized protein LOC115401084 [Salarias fasciatus]|uniref:uncharacterized protein LOC115401084 n=1 Tax=Salarias fasciatus TaxID=181472 RepID=UPI00117688C5|nr:uncharacterized protein LOC115401084 [Salarias fasciatus]XP_029965113.1 uncharacterized protein LOC115401084 [Salarias fasciatus]
MEGTTTLWLFLLLGQLPICPTDADQDLSAIPSYSSQAEDLAGSTTAAMEPDRTTTDGDIANGTRADCLIDTEMGLIALGSAGGLIVCLLITTGILACQVCQLQRRVNLPRSSRSNMDLVSSAGYWGADQQEVVGLVGPCDASVVLEEVTADSKTEEDREDEEREAMEMEEAGEGLLKGAAAAEAFQPEEVSLLETSRDSCLVIPRDLEDMPLVV